MFNPENINFILKTYQQNPNPRSQLQKPITKSSTKETFTFPDIELILFSLRPSADQDSELEASRPLGDRLKFNSSSK